MSRHQDSDKSRPGSGRQGGYKKDSNSRGNAPIRKAPSKFKTKPEAAKEAPKAPKSPKKPSNPDEIRLTAIFLIRECVAVEMRIFTFKVEM